MESELGCVSAGQRWCESELWAVGPTQTMERVNADEYAAFLPAEHRATMTAPVSTWWDWRGRRVHVARAENPSASVRLVVVHGGGGYSAALWPGASVAAGDGVEVLAPDLPLYGDTYEPDPAGVRYDDWVDLLCDFVRVERRTDQRPLILFGASMGGMLAYEVAARTKLVDAVLATCLLDTADPQVRKAVSRFPVLGRPSATLLKKADPLVGRVRVPIRWLADMNCMSNNADLSRLCASDPRGGGASVPLGFLSSWLNYRHTAPERYDAAPVTLVAPGADAWTPKELSLGFLHRISAPTTTVLLENCGHFPIEEPGLTQLRDVLKTTVSEVGRAKRRGMN